jgi:uncharacterized protein (TIGR00297 family)
MKGGQRTLSQVLSNTILGIAVANIHAFMYYHSPEIHFGLTSTVCSAITTERFRFCIYAYIGHFACCCGDTFASEIGILSTSQPFLITTLKQVPKGPNGAVSTLGLASSVFGGFVIGVAAVASWFFQCGIDVPTSFECILLSTLGGLLGSLV